MNLLHLFTAAAIFVGSFSGRPAPRDLPVKTVIVLNERHEDAEFIPWTGERRLVWADFGCEPYRGTDAVASTSTSLGISYQISNNARLTYHVTCNFSKLKSWGLVKTDYILAHEQGHFDITEIFARKLSQDLQNYTFNRKTFRKDINDIYQNIIRQKEAMQLAYDEETDHSRKRALQMQWLDKIDGMLLDSEPYAQYP